MIVITSGHMLHTFLEPGAMGCAMTMTFLRGCGSPPSLRSFVGTSAAILLRLLLSRIWRVSAFGFDPSFLLWLIQFISLQYGWIFLRLILPFIAVSDVKPDHHPVPHAGRAHLVLVSHALLYFSLIRSCFEF